MNAPKPPRFPGFAQPGSDFSSVRDARRSVPFYVPIDLSIARNIASGTHLTLPISGNSFYSDPLVDAAGSPLGGVAIVHFQDTNLNPAGTPFTVAPQFIAKISFTQILIENPAQPGKFAVFIYGVDIDFTPGINAQVSITGNVSVQDVAMPYGTAYASNNNITAGTPLNVFAAGSNPSGLRLHDGRVAAVNGTGQGDCTLLAKATAPATIIDGDVLASCLAYTSIAGGFTAKGTILKPIRVPAGRRLDFMVQITDTGNPVKHLLYDLF